MRILGVILMLLVLLLGVASGGRLSFVTDIPSVVMLAGLSLGATLLSGIRIPTLLAVTFASSPSEAELREAIQAWKQVRTFVFASGWVGFLVGGITMGQFLDDPRAIGPGFSTAAVIVFYATFLSYLVFRPLQAKLELRLLERTS